MNAVTIPISSTQEPETKGTRKAWKPGAKDELIYRWVKFEGKRQTWVASALGISQPTVSRVIERYEWWQAHAEPGQAGRMNAEERRRAQRWATYERNEVIMQSALRLAYELEGFVDVSKTTTRRKKLVGQELESTSTSAVLDRSGTCCRFLRLAFRVNMEQLKLAELEPLEQLEPAEVEEIAEIDREGELKWQGSLDATEEELRSGGFSWEPDSGTGEGASGGGSEGEQMTNDQ